MRISYDDALPISQRRDDIAAALREHQVIVVAGETGSGKTTQLPKIALELGARSIAHTQPRRIAARSVAARIAAEVEVELGAEVGYAVRFDERRSADTQIALVTDGLLLAEIHHDRDLRRYDTIIVDEAHERSLSIDFLLGYLRQLLPRRPDLKVIVTSATIDVERFAELFDAPVIEVSGRTYPVEVRYRPLTEGESDGDQAEAIVAAIGELPRDGDILVFLSGEREIRDTAEVLDGKKWSRTEVLPLYGRLAAHDQQKIFSSHPGRRIVLATNVAETSLTVPGIRYVIDPGYARISRYSQRLKVQRLPIEPISQASAAQRAGRCGRVADGICIRLYAEDDFDSRPEFTDPEIHRTNLASVLLQMAALDLGAIEDFPFLDPPDSRSISDGRNLLSELGALAPGRHGDRMTRIGRTMSALPVDPRHARQIIAADRLGCLADVLVIVAGLSIQDPRERPTDKRQQADEKHARFRQPDSDFLSWLALWNYVHEQRSTQSHSKFRKLCQSEFLHYLRIREWSDVHAQLNRTVKDLGMRPGKVGADPDLVHQALLAGLLSHIGLREGETRDFLGARNARFALFPGSGLAKKPPRWVMAAELVETSRLFAREAARIQPEWAEQAGAHLLKRQYSEPHWARRRGAAMAKERATLYGVPVVVDRPVPLAKVDAPLARELFIRHALVQGEWRSTHRFVTHNAAIIAEAEAFEDRVRRRGVIDDESIFGFYDERIPADVVSARHFDSWWKKTRQRRPDLLDLSLPDLLPDDTGDVDEQFPTSWSSQSRDWDVSYVFEPGRQDDGVVVDVPLSELPSLDAREFAGNVPGHRRDVVIELIRSLPKRLRRSLVPVPDHAAALLSEFEPGVPLLDSLARGVGRRIGESVSPDDFDWAAVADHLKVTFRVLDEDGTELDRDRDVEALRERLRPMLRADLQEQAAQWERNAITTWDLGDLEPSVTVNRATGYPTLVDAGDSVSLKILDDPICAETELLRGTARLLALTIPSTTKRVLDGLDLRQRMSLTTAPYPSADALLADCRIAAIEALVVKHGGPVRNTAAFEALRHHVRADVHAATEAVVADVLRTLGVLAGVSPGPDEVGEDVRIQLSWLIHDGFVREAGAATLRRYPFYLQAARTRLTRPMDAAGIAVQDLEARFAEITDGLSVCRRRGSDVRHVRWALEELRISTFAQGLGTAFTVSTKRLQRLLDDLEQTLQA